MRSWARRQQSTYEASLVGFFGKLACLAHDFRTSGGAFQFDNAGKDDNGLFSIFTPAIFASSFPC